MADGQLVLSEALCFITNKFGKTGRNELNSLRTLIVDFYRDEEISAAKCRLLDDIANVVCLTDKPPRVPRRREAIDPKIRIQAEVDDMFKQLIFLDEHKLMNQLPVYVSAKPDSNPTTKLCEGDLKFLFMYMDRMEGRLQGVCTQLSAITRDVRLLMRTETRPIQVPGVNDMVIPAHTDPTTTFAGVAQRPAGQPAGARSAAVSVHGGNRGGGGSRPTTGALSDRRAQPTSGATTKTNAGKPEQRHSSRFWGDGTDADSQWDSADEQAFVLAESRRQRLKRRKLFLSQEQEVTETDASADERGERAEVRNRPSGAHGRRRVRRAPLVIGKGKTETQSDNDETIGAAKPIFKKAIFCIDNVKPTLTAEKMQKFVEDLGIAVLSCIKVDSRRRRYESKKDAENRKAFRLCIKAEDRKTLVNADKWPEYVCVSEWYFVPPSKAGYNKDGVKVRDGDNGSDGGHDGHDDPQDDDEHMYEGTDLDSTVIDQRTASGGQY